jgi:hypothetical protein
MPINDWLAARLRPWVEDTLAADRLRPFGVLEPAPVRALLDRFYAGDAALSTRVWNLVSFQRWCETYLRSSSGARA